MYMQYRHDNGAEFFLSETNMGSSVSLAKVSSEHISIHQDLVLGLPCCNCKFRYTLATNVGLNYHDTYMLFTVWRRERKLKTAPLRLYIHTANGRKKLTGCCNILSAFPSDQTNHWARLIHSCGYHQGHYGQWGDCLATITSPQEFVNNSMARDPNKGTTSKSDL